MVEVDSAVGVRVGLTEASGVMVEVAVNLSGLGTKPVGVSSAKAGPQATRMRHKDGMNWAEFKIGLL